jgi:hypothetical protein
MLTCLRWSHSLGLSDKNYVWIFYCPSRASCLAHLIFFCFITVIMEQFLPFHMDLILYSL